MSFCNEYISPEDVKTYGIEDINRHYVVGATYARDWTIDRERNIYIRNVANGREDNSHQSVWTLFFDGHLIEVGLEIMRIDRLSPSNRHVLMKIRYINAPTALQQVRGAIVGTLKEALESHKDGGVFSTVSEYSLELMD